MLIILFFFSPLAVQAGSALAPECRAIKITSGEYEGPSEFDEGLLWRIDKPGTQPSYIFGTIHVGDDAIVNLPDEVQLQLASSKLFVMEALPEPADAMEFSAMMFFTDGRRLADVLPEYIYNRTLEILSAYHLPEETIAMMKPWAAFVTMSYPPDLRQILDLHLMQLARESGAELKGLETLQEQGDIFNDLEISKQVVLLTDTVCYHDMVLDDFETMKSFYLKRDLKGLYIFGQRYAFDDNSAYEKLTDRILFKRNYTMVKRMEPALERGNAFIAIGAMHLPGAEGVLALLNKQNYTISRVY